MDSDDVVAGMGSILFIGTLIYSIFLIYLAFQGIAMHWGTGGAIAMIFFSVIFRTSIGIMIGAFIYAKSVWGWGNIASLIFVAPSLLLIIPGMIGSFFRRN